jgi:general stress protein 26
MRRSEARAFTLALMDSTPAVYLATVDEEGLPHIRAVSNLRDKRHYPDLEGFFRQLENPFVTYVTTYAGSGKARQIRRNARVALYYCRPECFLGVMLSGSMDVVRSKAVKESLWQEEWVAFWSKGPGDRRYRAYRFEPDGARGWNSEETFRFPL